MRVTASECSIEIMFENLSYPVQQAHALSPPNHHIGLSCNVNSRSQAKQRPR